VPPAVLTALTHLRDILTCTEGCVRAAARWKPFHEALPQLERTAHWAANWQLCHASCCATGSVTGQQCDPEPLSSLVRRTGPGSPQQQQLYSLLASLMKAGDVNPSFTGKLGPKCRAAAADAAIALLAVGNGMGLEQGPPAQQATSDASSQRCSASPAHGAAASSQLPFSAATYPGITVASQTPSCRGVSTTPLW